MQLLDRKLIYFLSIAKNGSLQKAGQELGLTQPALTASIRKLEEELGVKLFERRRYGLELSTQGQHFKKWLAEHSTSLELSFRREYIETENVVRIGAGFFLLSKYLSPNVLKPIREKFKVQLLCQPFSELIRAIELDFIDFAFVGWNGSWRSDLSYNKIFDCPCAIVGAKAVFPQIYDYKKMSQLSNMDWVAEIDPSAGSWMTALQNRKGILVYQHDLFKRYVMEGRGVAEIEVPYFSPKEQLKLAYTLVPSQFKEGHYGVVYKNSIAPSKRDLAVQIASDIAGAHFAVWPGMKNGSPERIRSYVEGVIK